MNMRHLLGGVLSVLCAASAYGEDNKAAPKPEQVSLFQVPFT